MATADDVARVAGLLDLRIPREELERLAPLVSALLADLERLRDLPIDDREPAFVPSHPLAARSGETR
jgi:Asp-tRNA(Asn)/Glu-tRNA(Gln) amidotransferase C subunit